MNSKGMSIVGVLVGVAITGIIGMTIMTMMDNGVLAQNGIAFKMQSDNLHDEVRTLLGNPAACLNTFNVNPKPDLDPAKELNLTRSELRNGSNNVAYNTTEKYGDKMVGIESMVLDQYEDVNGSEGKARFTIVYKAQKRMMGAATVPRTVVISTMRSGGTMTSCWAQSAGNDSLWTKVGSEIHYTGGSAGIGTANPAQLLDVARSDAGNNFIRVANLKSVSARDVGLIIENYRGSNLGSDNSVYFRNTQGSEVAPEASRSGNGLGAIYFQGQGSDAGTWRTGASILAKAENQTWTNSKNPSSLAFQTNDGTSLDTRFVIHWTGKVGIGLGTVSPVSALHVGGEVTTGDLTLGTESTRTDSGKRGQLAMSSTFIKTANVATNVDWQNGNMQELASFRCDGAKAITFANFKDGGAYSLLISGNTAHSGRCVFTAAGYTILSSGGDFAPKASRSVLFTFGVFGNNIVYSMMDDLQ